MAEQTVPPAAWGAAVAALCDEFGGGTPLLDSHLNPGAVAQCVIRAVVTEPAALRALLDEYTCICTLCGGIGDERWANTPCLANAVLGAPGQHGAHECDPLRDVFDARRERADRAEAERDRYRDEVVVAANVCPACVPTSELRVRARAVLDGRDPAEAAERYRAAMEGLSGDPQQRCPAEERAALAGSALRRISAIRGPSLIGAARRMQLIARKALRAIEREHAAGQGEGS